MSEKEKEQKKFFDEKLPEMVKKAHELGQEILNKVSEFGYSEPINIALLSYIIRQLFVSIAKESEGHRQVVLDTLGDLLPELLERS